MKLAWSIACWLVAYDCFEKAVGLQQQTILAADAVWVWWVPAAVWSVIAFLTLMGNWRSA